MYLIRGEYPVTTEYSSDPEASDFAYTGDMPTNMATPGRRSEMRDQAGFWRAETAETPRRSAPRAQVGVRWEGERYREGERGLMKSRR
jgi:hypothetical protein